MESFKLTNKVYDITFCMADCVDTSCMRHLANAPMNGYTSMSDFSNRCTDLKQNNIRKGNN